MGAFILLLLIIDALKDAYRLLMIDDFLSASKAFGNILVSRWQHRRPYTSIKGTGQSLTSQNDCVPLPRPRAGTQMHSSTLFSMPF